MSAIKHYKTLHYFFVERFTILEYTLNYNPKIFTSNILIVGGGVVCNSFSLLCMLILREFMKSAFHRYIVCTKLCILFLSCSYQSFFSRFKLHNYRQFSMCDKTKKKIIFLQYYN